VSTESAGQESESTESSFQTGIRTYREYRIEQLQLKSHNVEIWNCAVGARISPRLAAVRTEEQLGKLLLELAISCLNGVREGLINSARYSDLTFDRSL
jgi:hypothetical protein